MQDVSNYYQEGHNEKKHWTKEKKKRTKTKCSQALIGKS